MMRNRMLKLHNRTIREVLGRNPIHPFPARMAPGIALDVLGKADRQLSVLDPMAGSGTVLAVARAKGHRAFGVDVDPLSVLLSKVWIRPVNSKMVTREAERVEERARRSFAGIRSGFAYPRSSNEETRKFLRYWFDDYVRRQLTALCWEIERIENSSTRDTLWCAFSKMIIAKQAGVSLAMDLSHSRPHKVYSVAPVKPFDRFAQSVASVVANCCQVDDAETRPPASVKLGDARELSFSDESMDLVLTSPPYLNAIDYIRCSKFSLVWMGYNVENLRQIRATSIGTEVSGNKGEEDPRITSMLRTLKLEPALPPRLRRILGIYTLDMLSAVGEVARVLKDGGRAVYVVGDSTLRGTFIKNSEIVVQAAEACGLHLTSRHSRSLPASRRYLPPPKKSSQILLNSRMRKEVVLVFDKTTS
jgi:DNA modification methylase